MHLKQLKLAGFKSFVDPTVIPFPSQLCAVVGPNGCGKSNIIDAVRWVMGESSAKNLRGESMTDVIFNGSSNRKAVGQASIELTFDNSLGKLTGQYASYHEIAVKRVVTRDGDSSYFLNGSRCRRRDITDIFLGTGAGARGYSIIGQGTISRIIEARPEELRTFFEEASGISKYKERRRETLTRIEHTRENLARIADIRDELTKQLNRLERQAKAAERYKTLRAEERLYKTEILALKWQSLTKEQQEKNREIQQLLLANEKHLENAAKAYKESTIQREKIQDGNQLFQDIQASYYQLATEIARLEEGIQQQQREKQRLRKDQQQLQIDWQNINSQQLQDKENLHASEIKYSELQQRLEELQNDFNLRNQDYLKRQEQQKSGIFKIQDIQNALTKTLREKEIEEFRLQNFSERRQQISSRLEAIHVGLDALSTKDLISGLENQKVFVHTLKEQMHQHQENYHQLSNLAAELRQQSTETEKLLHQAQDRFRHLQTNEAALKVAQQTALGRNNKESANLIFWADKPRLVEMLKIEKNWQFACEFIFAESLEAIVVDSLDELWLEIPLLIECSAQFWTSNHAIEQHGNFPSLADKITGLKPNWLYKIHLAASLDEAITMLPKLSSEESVITEQGFWLAKNWVKIAGNKNQDDKGLIVRQEELASIKEESLKAEEALNLLKEKRDNLHLQVKVKEEAFELARKELEQSREILRTNDALLSQKESVYKQANIQQKALNEEAQALHTKLEGLVVQQQNAEHLIKKVSEEANKLQLEQGQLTMEKASWDQSLEQSRLALDAARTAFHQSQLDVDREKLKIQQLKSNLAREFSSLKMLAERLELVNQQLVDLNQSDFALKEPLDEKIQTHAELEIKLNHFREQLTQSATQLESWEALIKSEEKFARSLQEKIQQEQMQEQALALRAGGMLETLSELEAHVEAVLQSISADINQNSRERQLEEISDNIKYLGAINLAAIEEFESEFQRKQHLEEQYQDLTEALATLDEAIQKMDKETHQRLKTTFDEVNNAFQALFPRLFGGGRAMLELTCDNLVEAGVLVMAQPPGKRNSTIHLLSGGEKAMTAVALVFAIFQLNPSPFCMLDEVDAPLDDVNVGRFCSLVKEMSQVVQFLFITHNKVTMELADHLIGVTMREPGVSRIVAVDVEEALAMAEA